MQEDLKKTEPLYYFHDGIKQLGPFTKKELKENDIKKDTLIWQDDLDYWQKAETIKGLRDLFNENPYPYMIDKTTKKNPPPFSPKYIKEPRMAVLPRRSKILMIVSSFLGIILILGIVGAKLRKDDANIKAMDAFQLDPLGENGENKISEEEAQIAVQKMLEEFEKNGKKKKVESNRKKKQLEKEEIEREFENKKKRIRNNFKEWITVKQNNYDSKEFGGIYDLNIAVSNASPFLLEKVEVSINYIKANGDIYKVEKIYFENIPPESTVFSKAPNSDRGKNISHSITLAKCLGLNLCFKEGKKNNNHSDPYLCK